MDEHWTRATQARSSFEALMGFSTLWMGLAVSVAVLLALVLAPRARPRAKRTLVDRVAGGSVMYVMAYLAPGLALVLLFLGFWLAEMD